MVFINSKPISFNLRVIFSNIELALLKNNRIGTVNPKVYHDISEPLSTK